MYVSNPHFYKTSPELLEAVEGLSPSKEKHESYLHIQPKLGVPLKATVRAQMNFKVEQSSNVEAVKNFRDFTFPVMWLEEVSGDDGSGFTMVVTSLLYSFFFPQGVAELTPSILKWIYMAVELGPVFVPLISYGFIVSGAFLFIYVFVRAAYNNMELAADPAELLEMGRRTLRSASLVSHHVLHIHRDSYLLLRDDNNTNTGTMDDKDTTTSSQDDEEEEAEYYDRLG